MGEDVWLPAEQFPGEPRKIVLAAFDNPELLKDLGEVARGENARVRLARPQTPDIIPFPGNVKIIDREYVGLEYWEAFCEFLEQVNQEPPSPKYEEDKETPGAEELLDETPLIIVDRDLERTRQIYEHSEGALAPVHYIQQDSVELIVHLTSQILRESQPIDCNVKAGGPPESAVRLDD